MKKIVINVENNLETKMTILIIIIIITILVTEIRLVRDHYTYKYRGAAHSICNMKYKILKETPTHSRQRCSKPPPPL